MKRFLLTALFFLIGSLAFAQERIAVFPFEDMDNLLTKNESVFFYRQFSNEFTNKNAGKFTIVPRQDVEKLFSAEEKFQLSDLSAKAKTAETQRVLNGTQILSGAIGKVGNRITVSVSLYTYPELSQLPGGVDLRVANKDELFDKIPELVQSMLSAIGGRNSAKVYFDRGMLFKNRKDLDTAILDFNEAIRLDPDYTLAYYCRGEVYRDKGDYNKAIADYTKVIQLEPNYKWAYFNRGDVYSRKRDYDSAIADFTQFIRLDPNEKGAYLNRGLAYLEKQDYDKAIADCSIIISLDPNYVAAYFNRGLAYYDKKDYERAIADYNQILKLIPNNESAYSLRGNAYYSKGDYNQALADYNKAIQIDSNVAEPYNGRGNVYYSMGKYDQAIVDYETALRIYPNHPTARNNLENARKRGDNKR